MSIGSSIAIGVVCGLRSMTGPAVVAQSACSNAVRLKRTPLSWLSSGTSARTTALLAVGELIADKLPGVPARTKGGPLLARGISGALCGVALAAHGTGFFRSAPTRKLISGAVAGCAGAIVASFLGLRYRKSVTMSPFVAALLEDAAAVGLGALAVRSLD